LGLVFLVIASLASAFLINPLCVLLKQPESAAVPYYVLIPGIIGAILCVIERRPQGLCLFVCMFVYVCLFMFVCFDYHLFLFDFLFVL